MVSVIGPVQSHYHEGSPVDKRSLRWKGFVEKVGFERGVKEWRSDGWWERGWWEIDCHKHFVVVSAINKLCRLLPAISVTSCHGSAAPCFDNTWRSQRWQHATKPDTGREARDLPYTPAFNAPVGGPRRNIAVRFATGKKLDWCG